MANFVKVTFGADAKQLDSALDKLNGQVAKTSKLSGRLKSALKVGAIAGLGALGAAAKIGFGEFMESQKVMAQTNAVLKSTGGAAKVTAGHVSDLAGSLMRKSGVDDELIQSGANVLLTFTKIRNEVGKGNDIFDQATKATLDMSVALGQDMKSSSILVGKALNDPIKGMSALGRAGIQFTADQKETIKTLVESGRTMDAQKLILKELETQFGGSAEAAGKTLPGQLNILKETFNNLAGQGVGIAITKLMELVAWARERWPAFKAAIVPTLEDIRDTFQAIWARFGPLVEEHLKTVIRVAKPLLEAIRDAVQLVMALLRGDWSEVWDNLKGVVVNTLKAVWELIKGAAREAKLAVGAVGSAIKDAIASAFSGVFDALTKPFVDAYNRISGIIRSIRTLGGLIGDDRGGSTTTIRDATRASRHVGGIVPGPRGTPTAIMALGGERVLSPGNSGSGGDTYIITVAAGVDGNGVVEAIREYTRRNGPLMGVAA